MSQDEDWKGCDTKLNEDADELYEDEDEWIDWYEGPDPGPLHLGDRLFINDQAQIELDTLEGHPYSGFKSGAIVSYSNAYMEAAERLVQTFHQRSYNTITLPIVFLYRHYIELKLKELIDLGNKRYSKPSTPHLDRILKGHRIDHLWYELKPLLQQAHPVEKNDEIEAVEACIMELSKVDEGSFSFRYPVDKKNNLTLKNNPHLRNLEYIDVDHLAHKMASIYNFFTSSWAAIVLD
jgi:hypothetical protein